MTKTCGECRFFEPKEFICCHSGDEVAAHFTACFEFEPKVITNGDKIRQGGDDELIVFADGIRRRMCHYCLYSKYKICVDKAGNCWEGVRAWLNAPAESEGEDD